MSLKWVYQSVHSSLQNKLFYRMLRYVYGTAFWSIKAEIGMLSPETGRAEVECLYRTFYRSTTHMFN